MIEFDITLLKPGHEAKLLIMCREFFSECPEINTETYFYAENAGVFLLFTGAPSTRVHWYQLAITELPKKVKERESDFDIGDFLYEAVETKNMHPVDYLYDFCKARFLI